MASPSTPSPSTNPSTTALLLIDIQLGFTSHPSHWGPRSNPSFERNTASLLSSFRAVLPPANIIHVAHHSREPGSPLAAGAPGTGFQPYALPREGEQVVRKDVNSAFVGTGLEAELRGMGVRRVVVGGLTTDRCVSTTVRMANNLRVCRTTTVADDGSEVIDEGEVLLVGDATATHAVGGFDAETVHKVHEATLGDEFCTVVTTAEALRLAEALKGGGTSTSS